MSKRPNYRYRFDNTDNAELFLKAAQKNYRSAGAQHPQQNGVPDLYRVFVTGSGSDCYDFVLKDFLDEKAAELGGDFEPHL